MRRTVLGLLAGVVVLVLVLSGSSVTYAHGDTGLMAIDATPVSTSAGAPGELTVTVRITFANDGDPAPGAVATATATEVGGTVAAPVTLADAGDGNYTGAMLLPTHGSWTVRVDSTNPVASAEQVVEIAPPPSTTTSTTDPEVTASNAESAASTSSKSSDDTTTVVLVAIAAVLVAAALTTWLILRSRRSRERV